jgi:alpha-amylase
MMLVNKDNFYRTLGLKTMFKIFTWYFLLSVAFCRSASEWRSRSVYQLLTDRFASDESPLRCTEQVLLENTTRNYCGGTYRAAISQLDYITDLGFDAIWISPIPSNVDGETVYGVGWHGYWQNHLETLNRNFGTEEDLIEFIRQAHARDIWVMLDVVANHVGPNLTNDYTPFNRSEHYHQPLCFIEDYSNQTQVKLIRSSLLN